MSSTDPAAQSLRTVLRATRRILCEAEEIARHMRAICEAERVSGRSEVLMKPVEPTTLAKGLSVRNLIRISDEVFAASRPRSGKRERRVTKRRISAAEFSRVRETVYQKYEINPYPPGEGRGVSLSCAKVPVPRGCRISTSVEGLLLVLEFSQLFLLTEFCPRGPRQRLTVNKSILLV